MIANADDGILRRVNCRDSATPGGRASHRRKAPTCQTRHRLPATTHLSLRPPVEPHHRHLRQPVEHLRHHHPVEHLRHHHRPLTAKRPCPVWHQGGQYAEWIWRVLAYIIDYIPAGVLAGIGYLFAILLTSTSSVVRRGELYGTPYSYTTVERSTSAIGLILAFIFYLLALAYLDLEQGLPRGTTGKSIGKQITGYTTLKRRNRRAALGFGMGFVRLLLLWVDFAICYIGVLWPLWDAKRQCLLSDKVTGAVVYKD